LERLNDSKIWTNNEIAHRLTVEERTGKVTFQRLSLRRKPKELG